MGMMLTYSTKRAQNVPRRGKAELIIGHLSKPCDKKRAKNGPLPASRLRVGERTNGKPLFQNGTGRRENGVGERGAVWLK